MKTLPCVVLLWVLTSCCRAPPVPPAVAPLSGPETLALLLEQWRALEAWDGGESMEPERPLPVPTPLIGLEKTQIVEAFGADGCATTAECVYGFYRLPQSLTSLGGGSPSLVLKLGADLRVQDARWQYAR